MRRIFYLFLLVLTFVSALGQSLSKVDSLKVRLNNYKSIDNNRARLLLNLAYFCNSYEALNYGAEAISVSQKIKNKEYEAMAWEYCGSKHRLLGNYLDAINSYIKSSELFRELDMKKREAYTYFYLGTTFSANNDNVNALKYMRRSISMFTTLGDSLILSDIFLNIGETFRIVNMLDSAEYYFYKALKLKDFFNDDLGKLLIIGNIGLVHSDQGKTELAKSEISSAIEVFSKMGDSYLTSYFQSEMANIFIEEGDKNKGENLLLQSFEIAKNDGLKEQIRDISLKLAEFYEKERDFKKALNYQKQFKIYNDSLKDVETVRAMEQQQSKFEQVKLEKEITSLNKINKLQRNISLMLALGVAIVTVFTFFLLRLFRISKKTNRELSIQKQLLEKREKEKALLLRELNHRVKNNLQMVASLLNLQARQLKGHPAAEALISCKYRVESLTLMHRKLYRDDVDTTIDLKDYIEELSNNLVMNFGSEFQLNLKLESLKINIDKAIPLGLIMNEIITNSLKYGKNDNPLPKLSISVENIDSKVFLNIGDNGKGLPEGFDWRSSDSFGLKLVHSLVLQLEGEIDYEGDVGSKWLLTLDKNKLL
ncbi:MAG: histidine kinase [Prolixibacteraceae bacterium]|nr:histidine kinase [Prolixibacteraceae bacterium]